MYIICGQFAQFYFILFYFISLKCDGSRKNWDSVICIQSPLSSFPTSIKRLFILFILIGLASWYPSSNVSSPCYSRVQRFLESPESTIKTSCRISLHWIRSTENLFSRREKLRQVQMQQRELHAAPSSRSWLTNRCLWTCVYLPLVSDTDFISASFESETFFEIRIYSAIRTIFFQTVKNTRA